MRPAAEIPSLDAVATDPTLAARLPRSVRSCLLSRCAAVLANLAATMSVEQEDTTSVPEAEQWLRLAEVVQRTGYGDSTVRAWVAKGILKRGEDYVGEGKKRRFLLSAIKSRLSEEPTRKVEPSGMQAIPFVRKERRHG